MQMKMQPRSAETTAAEEALQYKFVATKSSSKRQRRRRRPKRNSQWCLVYFEDPRRTQMEQKGPIETPRFSELHKMQDAS